MTDEHDSGSVLTTSDFQMMIKKVFMQEHLPLAVAVLERTVDETYQ